MFFLSFMWNHLLKWNCMNPQCKQPKRLYREISHHHDKKHQTNERHSPSPQNKLQLVLGKSGCIWIVNYFSCLFPQRTIPLFDIAFIPSIICNLSVYYTATQDLAVALNLNCSYFALRIQQKAEKLEHSNPGCRASFFSFRFLCKSQFWGTAFTAFGKHSIPIFS